MTDNYPQPPSYPTAYQHVITERSRPNHVLHFVLTLLTCGWWSNVWIVLTARYWGVGDYRNPTERPGMKRRTIIAVLVLVALNIATAVALSAALTASSTSSASPTIAVGTTGDSTTGDTAPARPTITTANYSIKVKTLSKHCFGSAGCNIEARLTLSGDPITDGVPVELTVKVTGSEDGPDVETITLDEDGHYDAPEVLLSTRSAAMKIRAKITDLEIVD
jgi:hypothetical protein